MSARAVVPVGHAAKALIDTLKMGAMQNASRFINVLLRRLVVWNGPNIVDGQAKYKSGNG
jgi:hypothetical protein